MLCMRTRSCFNEVVIKISWTHFCSVFLFLLFGSICGCKNFNKLHYYWASAVELYVYKNCLWNNKNVNLILSLCVSVFYFFSCPAVYYPAGQKQTFGVFLLAHKTQIDAVVLKLHVRLYELKLFIICSVHYSGETEGSERSARKTTK